MHDTDLTEAVTAAARRLWTEHWEAHYGGVIKHAEPSLRAWQGKQVAAEDWDEGLVDLQVMNRYRELVLPIVWAAHQDIARQAWQQGHETPRDYVVDLTLGGEDAHVIVGPPQPNPYDPENIPSEAGPHE